MHWYSFTRTRPRPPTCAAAIWNVGLAGLGERESICFFGLEQAFSDSNSQVSLYLDQKCFSHPLWLLILHGRLPVQLQLCFRIQLRFQISSCSWVDLIFTWDFFNEASE
jgi:hypothetical protein